MILWLNGAFGAGKTTTAELIRHSKPEVRSWDPEEIGMMLRTVLGDIVVRDFQDWSAWRDVVVATGTAVVRQTGQHVVAAQSVLREDYMNEILSGFRDQSVDVMLVLLDAPAEALRDRIERDPLWPGMQWRVEHVVDYEVARPWMATAADLVIDTTTVAPAEAAQQILAASGIG